MAKEEKAKARGRKRDSRNEIKAKGKGLIQERIPLGKKDWIKSELLRKTDLVTKAEAILNFALSKVEPANLINQSLKRVGERLEVRGKGGSIVINLESYHRIFLVAIGKSAPFMARAFLHILGDRIDKGIVVCLPSIEFSWPRIERLEGPHPSPDERSLKVAEKIAALGGEIRRDDLVFFLISGGASAQMAMPVSHITLADKSKIGQWLMEAGADIRELNVVRKHLSQVKGGRLGKLFGQATIINLFISDVIDDDLETIASAPTTWDSSTYSEAKDILIKYNLWEKSPESIQEVIEKGLRGEIEETRKKEEIDHQKLLNIIIGNIEIAVEAVAEKARQLGFYPLILSPREKGEAREKASLWATLIQRIILSPKGKSQPLALISGGELTVTVKGKGKGGRNMEFCLALLKEIMARPLPENYDWCAVSLATDGSDGPTRAAGAIIFPMIIGKAFDLGLDPGAYLDDNDSLTFFEKVGSLIITGITGTNVMDLRLFLLKRIEP